MKIEVVVTPILQVFKAVESNYRFSISGNRSVVLSTFEGGRRRAFTYSIVLTMRPLRSPRVCHHLQSEAAPGESVARGGVLGVIAGDLHLLCQRIHVRCELRLGSTARSIFLSLACWMALSRICDRDCSIGTKYRLTYVYRNFHQEFSLE